MKIIAKPSLFLCLILSSCGGSGDGPESVRSTSQHLDGDPSKLANENETATAFGNVAYGANGSFFYRTMGGSFTCNNQTFGDPTPGVVKACFLAPSPNRQMATQFQGNSPSGSYYWADEAQGLAHDSNNWFLTRADGLWRVPLNVSLATDYPWESPSNPNSLWGVSLSLDEAGGNPNYATELAGYNHFGDLDYHSFGTAHALFVPTQGDGKVPLIVIFNADTLAYVASIPIPAVPNSVFDNMHSGGWVAVRPGASANAPVTLWMSSKRAPNTADLVSFVFDASHQIITENGDWANPPSAAVSQYQIIWTTGPWNIPIAVPVSRLSSPQVISATDRNGVRLTDIDTVQGGAFNEDGSMLYLLNGYCNNPARLHIFQVSASGQLTLAATSYNSGQSTGSQSAPDTAFNLQNSTPEQICRVPDTSFWNLLVGAATAGLTLAAEAIFDQDTHCYCAPGSEEAEGLDYFDTRGLNIPGVPASQLHAMVMSNEVAAVLGTGHDNIWLKHYSFPATQPSAPPDTNLALGHYSYQSSDPIGASAGRANDGNTDGNFWDGSVSHTDQGWVYGPSVPDYPGQWWFVDLGGTRTVDGVNIYNRTDCCGERLGGYNILGYNGSSWFVISNHAADSTAGRTLISEDFDVPVQAQFVMIAKTDQNYLQLAEVQVMGH